MKELIILAREQPLAFVVFILFLFGTGTGSGYITGAFGQEETVKKANEYTDSKVNGVKKEMNKGFDAVNCSLDDMKKKSTLAELYGLEERENTEPNADRRKRIKQLKDEVSTYNTKLSGCK